MRFYVEWNKQHTRRGWVYTEMMYFPTEEEANEFAATKEDAKVGWEKEV